jgi:hypothetical protein
MSPRNNTSCGLMLKRMSLVNILNCEPYLPLCDLLVFECEIMTSELFFEQQYIVPVDPVVQIRANQVLIDVLVCCVLVVVSILSPYIKRLAAVIGSTFSTSSTMCVCPQHFQGWPLGRGRSYVFAATTIDPYIVSSPTSIDLTEGLVYVDYVDNVRALDYDVNAGYVHVVAPLNIVLPHLSRQNIISIARVHDISINRRAGKDHMLLAFENHNCLQCSLFKFVFSIRQTKEKINEKQKVKLDVNKTDKVLTAHVSLRRTTSSASYPPPPLSQRLTETVISEFSKSCLPSEFEEAGCAVCGELTLLTKLSDIKHVKRMLDVLDVQGVTRKERHAASEIIQELEGPVSGVQSRQQPKHHNNIVAGLSCRQSLPGV